MRVDEAMLRRLAEEQRDPRLAELAWDVREGKVSTTGLARHPLVAPALARAYRDAFARLREDGIDPTAAGRAARDHLDEERSAGRLTDEDVRTGRLPSD